jgi:peptide/nickel transport system substrate-binding protein
MNEGVQGDMSHGVRFTRREMLRACALAAGTTAVSEVFGLGRASAQGTPRLGGVLRVSVNERPNTLNPLRHINNAEYMLGALLYSGLTRLTPHMTAGPDLAVSWEANADQTQWTFHLRRGARFQTGQEVTSADVVATIEKILDPATASPGRLNIGPIERVVAVDPYTVEFRLSGPYADLPVALTYMNAKIIPRDVIEHRYDQLATQTFGSGPFKLSAFVPGSTTRVARNPNYFMRNRPFLAGIEQVVYPDPTAEVAAFLDGETDIITTLPYTQYDHVKNTPGVRVLRTPSGTFLNVVMRNDQPPFHDVRVRQALQASVDRPAVVQAVLEGLGTTAVDTPISKQYRYYKELPLLRRDVERARALLSQAGYAQGLKVTLSVVAEPVRVSLAVALQEMARPAGFDIAIHQVPYDTYISQIWRKANFYIGFYGMRATEDAIFNLLFTSAAPWNESRWNNATFDGLVAKARTTRDPGERRALYGQCQELMYREVPEVIPMFMDLLEAEHEYVQGFVTNPIGAVYSLDQTWLTDKAPRRG